MSCLLPLTCGVKGADCGTPRTAYTLQMLSFVNEKTGRITEPISNWELALYLYCKTEGDSSFRTNQVRDKLGEYYGKQGKPDTASYVLSLTAHCLSYR